MLPLLKGALSRVGGSLDPHPSVTPQKQLSGEPRSRGKRERKGKWEGKKKGWKGEWGVEPRVSPPDLGSTLLKSFPLLLCSLHGRGQEKRGSGKGL